MWEELKKQLLSYDLEDTALMFKDKNVEFSFNQLEELYSSSKSFNQSHGKNILFELIEEQQEDTFLNRIKCLRSDESSSENSSDDMVVNLESITTIINKMTKNSFPDIYKENTTEGSMNPKRDLFLWALLHNRIEVSKMIWINMDSDHIAYALVASLLLRSLSSKIEKRFSMLGLSEQLNKSAKEYELFAIDVLNTFYDIDPEGASYLLVRSMRGFGNKNLLKVAHVGDNKDFIAHECCQRTLTKAWYGSIPSYTTKKVIITSILIPLSFLCLIKFNDNYDPTNQIRNRYRLIQNKLKRIKGRKGEIIDRICSFFNAPVIKFSTHVLSHFAFVCMYAYFITHDLHQHSLSLEEYLVWLWVAAMWLDELRQIHDVSSRSLGYSTCCKKFYLKLKEYISCNWNKHDQLACLLLLIAVVLRIIHFNCSACPGEVFNYSVFFYVVVWVLFMLRFLQNFYLHENIGPRVEMLYNMAKDLWFFFLIYALFLFAYGIASHALLHPNSGPSLKMMKRVVYFPFLVIFQEFDGIKTNDRFNECFIRRNEYISNHENVSSKNHTLSIEETFANQTIVNDDPLAEKNASLLNHQNFTSENHSLSTEETFTNQTILIDDPTAGKMFMATNSSDDDDLPVTPECLLAVTLFAMYALITCVLLLNLLIAIFNSSFQNIEKIGQKAYRFYRVDIIAEYLHKPPFPPPLNILSLLFSLCCKCYRKFRSGTREDEGSHTDDADPVERRLEEYLSCGSTDLTSLEAVGNLDITEIKKGILKQRDVCWYQEM